LVLAAEGVVDGEGELRVQAAAGVAAGVVGGGQRRRVEGGEVAVGEGAAEVQGGAAGRRGRGGEEVVREWRGRAPQQHPPIGSRLGFSALT